MSWQDRPYAQGPGGGGGFGGLGGGRFSDNPLNWSPTIGHVFGIRVRIHILFIVFIAFEFFRAVTFTPVGIFLALAFPFILFGSVFLHELGHCFAARKVGGSANDILMWPLGGLASVQAPRLPWPQFVTVVWGPIVNLILMAIAWVLMQVMQEAASTSALLNVFSWSKPTTAVTWSLLYWLFKLNLVLLIFNLYPMYPMDGGRMLHCVLWKIMGLQKGTMVATTVGMVAAFAMGIYGLATQEYLLLVIAFMGYMTCMQERRMLKAVGAEEDGYMGYDFSGGYTTLERTEERPKKKGLFARWREKQQQGAWEAKRREQQKRQDLVDEILAKVKEEGIASLTRKEKKLLEEATKEQQSQDRKHGF